ncbi:sigma-70 family RNA polymerase sigma factor [Lutimonas vermicola]|uniref:Sigma-70 family RNA polymerase sigma factor n=1 Tax=Lutimonas vermicola TaxID=414288 RepID=A0ABU9L4X2_9FLAO
MNHQESENLIELLKRGDQKTLEKIYLENREGFINFSKKYNVDENDAIDIYQDSILILRENAINGKIDHLQSNISTYLFAIGKYKIYHNFRVQSKIEMTNDFNLVEENVDFDVNLYGPVLTKEQELLKKYYDQLGDRCKSILNLFYYQGYNLDEIRAILNYSNKKVLKSQKSRCIKQLKDLVNKHYGKS